MPNRSMTVPVWPGGRSFWRTQSSITTYWGQQTTTHRPPLLPHLSPTVRQKRESSLQTKAGRENVAARQRRPRWTCSRHLKVPSQRPRSSETFRKPADFPCWFWCRWWHFPSYFQQNWTRNIVTECIHYPKTSLDPQVQFVLPPLNFFDSLLRSSFWKWPIPAICIYSAYFLG